MSKLCCELISSPVSYIWDVLEWNVSRRYRYCPCCPHGCPEYSRAQSVVFTTPGPSCKDVGISTVLHLLPTQCIVPWLLFLTPALLQFTSVTLTLILRRSRTGTVWFYTSTSNKRAARPKLYIKSLTRDLKRMYSRLTLVRISINL